MFLIDPSSLAKLATRVMDPVGFNNFIYWNQFSNLLKPWQNKHEKKSNCRKIYKKYYKRCIKKTSINIIKACYNHIKNKVNNIPNIFLIYLIKWNWAKK
jgi:hypothetical protein